MKKRENYIEVQFKITTMHINSSFKVKVKIEPKVALIQSPVSAHFINWFLDTDYE